MILDDSIFIDKEKDKEKITDITIKKLITDIKESFKKKTMHV